MLKKCYIKQTNPKPIKRVFLQYERMTKNRFSKTFEMSKKEESRTFQTAEVQQNSTERREKNELLGLKNSKMFL